MFADGGSRRNSRIAWYDSKRGRGDSPRNRFKLFYEQQAVREQQKEHRERMNIKSVKVQLMYGQCPVDFEIVSDDDESLTTGEVKSSIDFLVEQGFAPRSFGAGREDNIGKRGKVIAVNPVPNTKMFEVVGKLDDDGKEFKWKEFAATSFRVNDRFEIIRNDRGFKSGQLITDDLIQNEIPF